MKWWMVLSDFSRQNKVLFHCMDLVHVSASSGSDRIIFFLLQPWLAKCVRAARHLHFKVTSSVLLCHCPGGVRNQHPERRNTSAGRSLQQSAMSVHEHGQATQPENSFLYTHTNKFKKHFLASYSRTVSRHKCIKCYGDMQSRTCALIYNALHCVSKLLSGLL